MNLTKEQVYDKYFSMLFVHVMKFVDNTEDANDIVIVTFNKLFSKFEDFDTEAEARGFLYTASKNDAFNYLRKRKRNAIKYKAFVRTFGEIDDTANDQLDGMLLYRLNEELEKLPARSKQVIRMLYFDKLSYREVSQELDLAEKSVANMRKYALDLLRKVFTRRELVIFGIIVIEELKLV